MPFSTVSIKEMLIILIIFQFLLTKQMILIISPLVVLFKHPRAPYVLNMLLKYLNHNTIMHTLIHG